MKLTNQYLLDFLDFDPALDGSQLLFRAIRPSDIQTNGTDVVIHLPFQQQKCSLEMGPEPDVAPQSYQLLLRAYGSDILRVCIGFKGSRFNDSPMLEMATDLEIVPLHVQIENDEWIVLDNQDRKRAVFNLADPQIDYWSDLLPKPEETLNAVFYPDGDKAIRIDAYDQFFPARHDGLALAYVQEGKEVSKSTISFHADANEVFAGTGERFTKMDLSGKTLYLENQDGQGVNSRRTYKNIPFFVSSRQYGMFMHTSAATRISFADQSTRSVQFLVDDPMIDLFLIGGKDLESVLYNYRRLTGFPSMPPLWSFGIWMSRMTYFSADEVNAICDRLRKEEYPCDVIHLDTGWFKTDWLCEWKFNDERFPDPQRFMKDLRDKGYRVSLWQMPYIAADAEQHDEAVANKYIGPLDQTMKQGDPISVHWIMQVQSILPARKQLTGTRDCCEICWKWVRCALKRISVKRSI